MSFLTLFITLLNLWRPYFCKQQLFERARMLAIGFLGTIGKKTLSNVAIFLNHLKKGYEADCAFFSQRKWKEAALFDPLLKEALNFTRSSYVCVAADDTTVKKSGKKIEKAGWKRDPLSPPFHVNFLWGLRFLQFSLLIEPSTQIAARAIPVAFIDAPTLKKPGKKAGEEEKKAWKQAGKKHNLSTLFVSEVERLRKRLDNSGENKTLLMVCDGSFCNRICMNTQLERVELLVRCRRNARLCFAFKGENKRKKYADEKFTPEDVRQDRNNPWKKMHGFYGGKMRVIKYKEVNRVLWQGGTKTRPLKLVVLAPAPYKKSRYGKLYYKQPAYLFCTDMEGDVEELIQQYLNRWQIEVNHREEKSILGLGEAQVTNARSVERQPAFHIAVYSALLVAARKIYGDKALEDSNEPKWRKKPKRLSFRTMIGLMRSEIIQHPEILHELDINPVEIAILLQKSA